MKRKMQDRWLGMKQCRKRRRKSWFKAGNRLYISSGCQQNICVTLRHHYGGLEICDFREMLSITDFSEAFFFTTTPGILSVQIKLSVNQVAFAKLDAAAEKMYCSGDVHPFCCRSSHIPYVQMNADSERYECMQCCFSVYIVFGGQGKRWW